MRLDISLIIAGFLLVLVAPLAVNPLAVGEVLAKNSSNCNFIQNSDSRNYCLAEVNNNSSHCNFIQNSDRRNYCLGMVNKNSSNCNFIQDHDLRNQCLASI